MLAEDVVPGNSVLAIVTVHRLFGIIPFSICVGIIHRDVDWGVHVCLMFVEAWEWWKIICRICVAYKKNLRGSDWATWSAH